MHRFRCGKFAGRQSVSAGSRPAEGVSCRLSPGAKRRWTCCCAIGKQAKAGEGWVVLLSGEPGIGKSRLAESLLTGLKEEPHSCLRLFCSPHHTHSALYPIIEQLERIASFRPDSSARAKLARLEHLLGPTASNLSRDAAVVADLLAVPLDEHDATLALSPQQKLELTLTVLLEQIEGVAARAPLLIVFEDVHWIDPTSLELLDRIILRIADFPVLLVITFRPEFQPTWLGLRNVTMLPLSRLGRRDAAAIIGSMAQGKALPGTTVEQILLHSDGVPLYIEELTRSVLESGLQRETTDWVRFHRSANDAAGLAHASLGQAWLGQKRGTDRRHDRTGVLVRAGRGRVRLDADGSRRGA